MPDAKSNGFKPVAACYSYLKMNVPSILVPFFITKSYVADTQLPSIYTQSPSISKATW